MSKLMIVDDHAGVRTWIRELVALSSDEVCECASAEEAILAAPQFQPRCVTMDLRMPGLGGIGAVQALRSSNPAARIFVVSAFDGPDLRCAAAAAGAHRYVVKEDLAQLRAAVRAALDAPAAPQASAAG